jgi:hypothetical protein
MRTQAIVSDRKPDTRPIKAQAAELWAERRIPEATSWIIAKYSPSKKQALLAKVRYNRLIDLFIGFPCYLLQSNMRAIVPGVGEVETDEIYMGANRWGKRYVLPVRAKGGTKPVRLFQIEQDLALCKAKFPAFTCLPMAALFMADDIIALFSFGKTDQGVALADEKHYRLVPPDQMAIEDH